jgi:hypothetical protein
MSTFYNNKEVKISFKNAKKYVEIKLFGIKHRKCNYLLKRVVKVKHFQKQNVVVKNSTKFKSEQNVKPKQILNTWQSSRFENAGAMHTILTI